MTASRCSTHLVSQLSSVPRDAVTAVTSSCSASRAAQSYRAAYDGGQPLSDMLAKFYFDGKPVQMSGLLPRVYGDTCLKSSVRLASNSWCTPRR